jgi:hypothetical protein
MQLLHKRPHYEDLIDTISFKQPKIQYPNRVATFMRNSPYLSQFDGDSWIDLEEQENSILKQRLIQEAIRKMAQDKGTTHNVMQYRMNDGLTPKHTPSETSNDDSIEDTYNELDKELQKRALEDRVRKHAFLERVKAHLKDTETETRAVSDLGSESDWESTISDNALISSLIGNMNQSPSSTPRRGEQASSSTSRQVYPTGVNDVPLPKSRPKSKAQPKGRPPGSINYSTINKILYGDS